MLTTSIHSSVFWVNDIVCALSLVKQRHGTKIIKSATADIVDGDLLGALNNVCTEINIEKSQAVIFCGDMGNSIVFDLKTPVLSAKDTESLLDFEIVQRLPVALDFIKKQWRVIKTFDDNGSKKQIVRVVVIDLKQWNEKIDIIRQLNYRTDSITSVKLAVDPLCEGKDVVLYGLMDNFIWQYNDNFKRDIISVDQNTFESKEREFHRNLTSTIENFPSCINDTVKNAFCCSLLGGLYSFSSDFNKDKNIVSSLPKNMRVKRLVKQKMLSITLLILILITASFLNVPANKEQKKIKKVESVELIALRKEIMSMQDKNNKMKRFTTKLTAMSKSNNRSLQLTKVLSYLGEKLPSYCWLTNLRQNGGVLDFSVTAYSNVENILKDLGDVPKIDKKSLRKYGKRDDSVFVSMRAVWFDKNSQSKGVGASNSGGSKGANPKGLGGMTEDEKESARQNKVDYSSWTSMDDVKNVFRDPATRNNMMLNMKESPEYAKGLIDKVKSISPKAAQGMSQFYEGVKSGRFDRRRNR